MEKVGGNFNDKMREGWWEIKGNGLSYENLNFEFFIQHTINQLPSYPFRGYCLG